MGDKQYSSLEVQDFLSGLSILCRQHKIYIHAFTDYNSPAILALEGEDGIELGMIENKGEGSYQLVEVGRGSDN